MELLHPHLVVVRNTFLSMYRRLAKRLCNKHISGFGITESNETQDGNINARFYNFVLSSDGKGGIIPVWFIVYQYNNITPEYKAEAKAQIVGPKAMQAIKPVPMLEVMQQLAEFTWDHKHTRYPDARDKKSNYAGEALMDIRQTLLELDPYCIGQVYKVNPDTEEPDDRIVMVDLFLKDPSDINEDGAYKSKVKLVIASPQFVHDTLNARAA